MKRVLISMSGLSLGALLLGGCSEADLPQRRLQRDAFLWEVHLERLQQALARCNPSLLNTTDAAQPLPRAECSSCHCSLRRFFFGASLKMARRLPFWHALRRGGMAPRWGTTFPGRIRKPLRRRKLAIFCSRSFLTLTILRLRLVG